MLSPVTLLPRHVNSLGSCGEVFRRVEVGSPLVVVDMVEKYISFRIIKGHNFFFQKKFRYGQCSKFSVRFHFCIFHNTNEGVNEGLFGKNSIFPGLNPFDLGRVDPLNLLVSLCINTKNKKYLNDNSLSHII